MGQIYTAEPPSWLGVWSEAVHTSKNVPGYGPMPSLYNPVQGTKPDAVSTDEAKKIVDTTKVGQDFAHCIFLDMVLRNRMGSLLTRLRFDIAPGTPVKIELVGKNTPFGKTNTQKYIFAHVYKVEVVLDAENKQAYTSLQLTHIRTEAEQKNIVGMTVTTHPIYEQLWDGTSLLDGPEADTRSGIQAGEAQATGNIA
jgi:hypothetical protein